MHTRLRPILQDSLHRLLQPLHAGRERAHSDVQREEKVQTLQTDTASSSSPNASPAPDGCPICYEDRPLLPVSQHCIHLACSTCLQRLRRRDPRCPVCRQAFTMNSLSQEANSRATQSPPQG